MNSGDFVREIRALTPADAAAFERVARDLFDKPIRPALVAEFLRDPRHHLVAAFQDGELVGFASALHYVHPDKPTEMWINELAVAPAYQRRGIAKAILTELLALAWRLGCTEAWVLTDRDNTAAMRTYAAAGGEEAERPSVMFTFRRGGAE